MNPPVLVINLGDLIGLALALLLMSALGLYVLAGKASEWLKRRKNRQ
jgi:hypothetical protein